MKKTLLIAIALVMLFSLTAIDAQARPMHKPIAAEPTLNTSWSGFYFGVVAGMSYNTRSIADMRGSIAEQYNIKPIAAEGDESRAVNKRKITQPKQRMNPYYDLKPNVRD